MPVKKISSKKRTSSVEKKKRIKTPLTPPLSGGKGFSSLKSICFYFQVHQPYRLREVSFFEGEESTNHFEGPANAKNRDIFNKVADKCYLPATKMFLELLEKYPEFRVSFSLSGVFLDQCEEFPEKGKEVLSLFQQIAKTGRAEFLAETYYHSLSFLFSKLEFAEQVQLHIKRIQDLFGVTPKVFRNTELIYSNEVAEFIRQMGFEGMLAEGWDPYLGEESAHFVRSAKSLFLREEDHLIATKYAVSSSPVPELPVLLKSYKLSDDVAFRFGNKSWESYPLDAPKFASWIEKDMGQTINLFMDYETIGEHQWEDTGIFDFFRALPEEILKRNIGFRTPSETISAFAPRSEYDVHHYLSWADTERNLSAWLENDIQKSALDALLGIEALFHPHKSSQNPLLKELLNDFRRLQTSDHLYYMCTKYWSDGDVHKYFSPYDSPYEAYIHFMNALRILRRKLEREIGS